MSKETIPNGRGDEEMASESGPDVEGEVYDEESPDESGNDEEASDDEDNFMETDEAAMTVEEYEFEALPLDTPDIPGLVHMLTQIFLRVDVDCDGIANALVKMAPLGCVFRPAEEFGDDDNDSVVYGVVSLFEIGSDEKFQVGLANFILNRARKVKDNALLPRLQSVFGQTKPDNNFFFVNERMLNFSRQIAPPAFDSLKSDLQDMHLLNKINNVVVVSKIRISVGSNTQTPPTAAGAPATSSSGKKKKIGKAEKKRLAAAALSAADVIFDNPEEELLYNNAGLIKPVFFQYPVESDVESGSKFHRVIKNGVTYMPYRRVTVLTKQEFVQFLDIVANTPI